jgi:hypothetical protein
MGGRDADGGKKEICVSMKGSTASLAEGGIAPGWPTAEQSIAMSASLTTWWSIDNAKSNAGRGHEQVAGVDEAIGEASCRGCLVW